MQVLSPGADPVFILKYLDFTRQKSTYCCPLSKYDANHCKAIPLTWWATKSREFRPISRFISEMIYDRATEYYRIGGAISNDLEWSWMTQRHIQWHSFSATTGLLYIHRPTPHNNAKIQRITLHVYVLLSTKHRSVGFYRASAHWGAILI